MKSLFMVVALMVVVGICAGGDLMIDDFEDTGLYTTGGVEATVVLRDPGVVAIPPLPKNTRDSQGYPGDPDGLVSGVAGGRRDVQIIRTLDPLGSGHTLFVQAAGTCTYAAGDQLVGEAIWKYGTQCDAYTEYDDEETQTNPTTIVQGSPLNANLGGGGRFIQLEISNDHDVYLDVTLETNFETTPLTFTATGLDIPKSDTMRLYTIPLNSSLFTGITGTNLSDVDGIRFTFYPQNEDVGALDFRIDQIYTNIPEPATMTLLGLGSLGMLIRRRRKKS